MSPVGYYMVRQSMAGIYTFELVVAVAVGVLVLALWRATGDARPLTAYAIGGFYDWGIELVAAWSGTRTITPVELFGVLRVGFPLLPLILGFFEGGILVLAAFELTRGILERSRRSLTVGMGLVLGLGLLIVLGALGAGRLATWTGHTDPATLTVRALFTSGSLTLLAACWAVAFAYAFVLRRRDPEEPTGLLVWYGTILFAGTLWYLPIFLSGTRRIATLVDGAYRPVGTLEQIAVFFGFSMAFEAAGFFLPVYVILRALRLMGRR